MPLLLAIALSACETLPKHPLSKQILRVRQGYDGHLTHRRDDVIQAHSLSDPEFRKTLNDLDFICRIGNKRYKVCLDKPGYCRRKFEQKCFIFCGKRKLIWEKYLPASDHLFLVAAGTTCFNKHIYSQPGVNR